MADEANKTAHTPGPWEFREIAPHDDGLGYISADGHDIIHAGVGDLPADENRANARLIAAAPDLLDSAKTMLALVVLRYGNLDADVNELIDAARAAISKATEV